MAIFTLINTAMGVGMLTLPIAFANLGYVVGGILLVLGALNQFLGLYSFKYLSFKYNRCEIYSQLVGEILGEIPQKILNWVLLIYVWSSLVTYILISKKLML